MRQRTGRRQTRRLRFETLEARRLLAALNHTVFDQIVIEMINRARANPTAEATRLGIGLNDDLAPNTISTAPKPPLAPNELLFQAALAHSQDMVDRDYFDHVSPEGKNPGHRIQAVGYVASEWGENIAQAFGVEDFHDALFYSAGHRTNIMRPSYREIGVGLVDDFWGVTGTEKFGRRSGNAFITGVVFSDQRQADQFLNFGESLEGVTVTAQRAGGPLLSMVTGPSGAFSIQAPAGTYTVRASGSGLPSEMVRTGVVLGSDNVKVDFMVPFVPPASDAYEPNDTMAQAADLGTGDQFISDLTIHSSTDGDFFRWTSPGNGEVTIELRLERDGGDVDLVVYNSAGNWLGASETLNTIERVTLSVTAGQQLIIHAFGYQGDVHRGYDLVIDGPEGPVAPVARANRAMTTMDESVSVAILANDTAPDSTLVPSSVQLTALPSNGQAQWSAATQQLLYSPDSGFRGVDEVRYTVQNAEGLTSDEAVVRITVLDPDLPQWQNPDDRLDVNADGQVSPIDVLVLVNDINRNQSRQLPPPSSSGEFPAPYLDVNGDGQVSAIDVLLVVNYLNSRPASEGEASSFLNSPRLDEVSTVWPRNVVVELTGPAVGFGATSDIDSRGRRRPEAPLAEGHRRVAAPSEVLAVVEALSPADNRGEGLSWPPYPERYLASEVRRRVLHDNAFQEWPEQSSRR